MDQAQILIYLKETRRHSEHTIDAAAKALGWFEEYTQHRDFKTFRHEQAVAFKRHLAEQISQRTGEKLSKATRCSRPRALYWDGRSSLSRPG
jgi:site-specific recombinase XerD